MKRLINCNDARIPDGIEGEIKSMRISLKNAWGDSIAQIAYKDYANSKGMEAIMNKIKQMYSFLKGYVIDSDERSRWTDKPVNCYCLINLEDDDEYSDIMFYYRKARDQVLREIANQ